MIDKPKEDAMKIFIADDEKKVRNAIRLLIEAEDDYHICAEAANSRELFSYLNFCKPDLLLLDKDLSGLKLNAQGLQAIRKVAPQTKIIVMSVDINSKVMQLNADGIISKFCSAQMFLSTLQQVAPKPRSNRLSTSGSPLYC